MRRHVKTLTVLTLLAPLQLSSGAAYCDQACPIPTAYISVVCYPVYPPCDDASPVMWPPAVGVPAPTGSPGLLAQPTAAPPSEGPISMEQPGNPVAKKPGGPVVSENMGFYDAYALAPDKKGTTPSDRGTLVLWNLTNREVKIKVDSQAHALAAGKSLALNVARKFVWQLEGRDPQIESIATGEVGIEIVIRR